MSDLSTSYLGLQLKNPLILSASPLSAYIDNIKRMEQSGASAVVLPSLFEEQIELNNLGYRGKTPDESVLPEELKHIPNMQEYNQGASGYLAHIYQAKRAVNIPIFASINGYYSGGWVQYARLVEASGADALELNIYYLASKPHISGADIERMYLDLVQDVKSSVRIPVAVKISPYFSALAHMAVQLDQAGVNGLILFNRFYQPDFNITKRTIESSLDLSSSDELRLRLRWTALLCSQLQADIGVTGGVHTGEDVLKALFAGAKAVLIASVLLEYGIEHISRLLQEMQMWLQANGIETLAEIVGTMSQSAVADSAALERANYMNVLRSLEG